MDAWWEVLHIGVHKDWNEAIPINTSWAGGAAEVYAEKYDEGNYGLIGGEYIQVRVRILGETGEGRLFKAYGEPNPEYFAEEIK